MNGTTQEYQAPLGAETADPIPPDPQAEEVRRQVTADVREFGPRKYQVYYAKAKQLREGGFRPDAVRQDLVGEPAASPPVPKGGWHIITRVNYEKRMAFHRIVRHAVEDALAYRPPEFREALGTETEGVTSAR